MYIWELQSTFIMESERNWIVVRVDGKLAGISMDYGRLAEITAEIAQKHDEARRRQKAKADKTAAKCRQKTPLAYSEITAQAVSFDEILQLRQTVCWEDFMLFGTDFQKRIWKKLWELTTSGTNTSSKVRLLSYSDFAEFCGNRSGVRPVAHAIALNPLPVIIPCHLVVPKESIDKIREIKRRAESTIFKGEDLCLNSILSDTAIDFGEYAQGRELKRVLIMHDLK